jgi:outer membrane protein TolC
MKKLTFTLFLVLSCNLSVFAERINKQMVEAETLKNSPAIISAKLTLDAARLSRKIFLSGFSPSASISKSIEFGQWEIEAGAETEIVNKKTAHPPLLSANVSIPLTFDTYANIKKGLADLKIAELNYRRAVSDEIFNSNNLYLGLIVACEEVRTHERTIKRYTENRDLIKLKYRSGREDIGQLDHEESNLSIAKRNLRRSQKRVEEFSENLLVAMGRNDVTTTLEVDEHITFPKEIIKKPDYDSLITKIPEFLIAQYKLGNSKVSKTATNSHWLPSATVTGAYNPGIDNDWRPKKHSFDAKMTFQYPIFTGFKRYYESKNASNHFQAALLTFSKETIYLKKKAKKLYGELTDAYENMDEAIKNLELSKFRSEIAQKKYIIGNLKYNDLRFAEDNYISAQAELLTSKKNVAAKIAEWHNFTCDDFIEGKEE